MIKVHVIKLHMEQFSHENVAFGVLFYVEKI